MYSLFIGKKTGSFDGLEENVSGVVIVRCGKNVPLPRNEGNCFSFLKDQPIKDVISKDLQKPVQFFEALIKLYTNKGEWIWDAYSGTGIQCTCMYGYLMYRYVCTTYIMHIFQYNQ